MGITKTVGGNGRDYDRANYGNDDDDTLQAAFDFFNNYDFSSNGGGLCYIDIYPEGSGTDGEWVINTSTTGPTGCTNETAANHLVVRAAPGYSFKDHANKETNELRYNAANGVAIRDTGSDAFIFRFDCEFVTLSGLQLYMTTNNYGGPIIHTGSSINNFRVENCIFRANGGAIYTGLSGCDVVFVNTLWYGGSPQVVASTANTAKFINCTGYEVSSHTNYGVLRFDYLGAVVKNCLLYSSDATNDIHLANGATLGTGSGYNGMGDTSGGSNCVNNIDFANDVFRSVTAGSEDFRLKATLGASATAIATGGTDTSSDTSDLDIVGRSRNATTPTIGVWEYITAVTPQLAAPTSDISAGNWLRSSDGTGTGLYTMLDESTYSDTDYVYVNSDSTMEVKFASVSDPATSSGHKVRYRIKGNGVATITVSLRQGSGTEIASWSHTTASTTTTTHEQTLTSGQADSITDYADLRLRFVTFTP